MANLQPGTSHDRQRNLPLNTELIQVEEMKDALDEILQEEIIEFSVQQLKDLYARAKTQFSAYATRARTCSARLRKNGKMSEAETMRTEVVRKDLLYADFKRAVNDLLRDRDASEVGAGTGTVNESVKEWILNSAASRQQGTDSLDGGEGHDDLYLSIATWP